MSLLFRFISIFEKIRGISNKEIILLPELLSFFQNFPFPYLLKAAFNFVEMENINNPKKLFIKDMVCSECIRTVENIFRDSNIPFVSVALGEVLTFKKLQEIELKILQQELKNVGYDLLDSRVMKIVEKIKGLVREYITLGSDIRTTKLSIYITNRMNYDYSYLSALFSSVEKITIEKFLIQKRLDKVKELILENRFSLTKIASETGFSSVHHLSAQFKKLTGLTPTQFRIIASGEGKFS